MPRIGRAVHELRVRDPETRRTWRIVYRIDSDAILIAHWFDKTTQATPEHVVKLCRTRLARYDRG
jgi:phage-related protein